MKRKLSLLLMGLLLVLIVGCAPRADEEQNPAQDTGGADNVQDQDLVVEETPTEGNEAVNEGDLGQDMIDEEAETMVETAQFLGISDNDAIEIVIIGKEEEGPRVMAIAPEAFNKLQEFDATEGDLFTIQYHFNTELDREVITEIERQ
jgi:hypothetical protein